MRRVRVTTAVVKKNVKSECGFSLRYPSRRARALYYTVVCGLSGCTLFFTLSHESIIFEKKKF
jgi:hypothetical protein